MAEQELEDEVTAVAEVPAEKPARKPRKPKTEAPTEEVTEMSTAEVSTPPEPVATESTADTAVAPPDEAPMAPPVAAETFVPAPVSDNGREQPREQRPKRQEQQPAETLDIRMLKEVKLPDL